MWNKQQKHFDIRRFGVPIRQVPVKGAVSTGITTSLQFSLWDAAIAAGATLQELADIDKFPKQFRAKIIAWYEGHQLIKLHQHAAAVKAANKKGK